MSSRKQIIPTNKFRNNDKAIGIGNPFWDMSEQNGLAGIVAGLDNDLLSTQSGHQFVNFSCCSYLNLDSHSKVVEGAIDAVRRYGVLDHCIARSRVQLPAMKELEASLGELFQADVLSGVSASSVSGGLLPLIASGHLGNGVRPLMIFDKHAHVSLAAAKPACADETEVVTCNYHDLNFIEDCCKQYQRVCYVVDGSDSLGGYAPVKALAELQDKYGLMVFYDDSHSISAYGERGVGYVRSHSPALDENTIMVVTLNKAFGTSGAAILLNGYSQQMLRLVERFGGGLNYSQNLNTAAIGASLASAEIHRTAELPRLQKKLYDNIALFDSLIPTEQSGNTYPIRLVPMSDDRVIEAGRQVIEAGFYVSPVFFPIVAKGTAGLRVMMRAGQTQEQIRGLCQVISAVRGPQ
ncbi:aminotransferase class I and II [Serratia liquefaciens]|jgi:7-keto-8-aminopelargonate synthetase-like enzyme|uniref:8-amino-7-oxononanoate synthase family protein n=1 Tax=Serratia TaxID=613 RepID=UPI00065FF5B4|nr:aminotransferase class I/II-fold pyridoxal phosphate-dependent enzyme [Serratia liquefaciens]AMH01544.1 aminotransferase class I and II [Serratia liquefaciens]MBH2811131.1 aminotransferase class I/II-fold pyridoxal phosphate-dependent enzyme [Serratia liquefaciens]QNQ52766.1 aminotransferase class I/II-fold pyridoxal phosphate-dependent enzyme [Serratia liquefaciens]RYM60267.1 aminotransferase class I and II [Serratia liquefaciens]CAI0973060.1 2-amino-3-ketobutyrate coenzyme A ligase [Serra